ncbi:MAG: hypothetical protein ACPG8Q_05630, partial [Candidatus Poseidoniaceae archaeon]
NGRSEVGKGGRKRAWLWREREGRVGDVGGYVRLGGGVAAADAAPAEEAAEEEEEEEGGFEGLGSLFG